MGPPAPRQDAPAKVGQRERLIEGMTQVAARHGYAGATVARAIEQAGVSRATFYQHFADKEACFLAALETAAGRVEVLLRRIDADCPPPARAARLLDALLVDLVGSPAAARILLVEALAGGPDVRAARQRLTATIETTLERWLRDPDTGFRIGITGRAIMEGVAGILVIRSFRGETARLTDLHGDLLAWINSYALPPERTRLDLEQWRRLGAAIVEAAPPPIPAPVPQRLPRGKSAVSAAEAAAEHRERVLAAVAQLARTKGYAAMTVADVVKAASVSREAFYELFRDKEDAFLATQSVALERSIAATAAGFFGGESWPARVWDGLEALLGYIAMQPDLVYLDVFESYAVGAAAIRRSFDNKMAYTLFLEDGYRQGPAVEAGLPRLCSEAIGGAILGLLRWQVGEGRVDRSLELLPQAVYLALAPFVGPLAAIDLVEAKVAEAGEAATT